MKPIEELIAQANEIIDKLEPQVLEGSQRQYMLNMLVAMYGWGARDGDRVKRLEAALEQIAKLGEQGMKPDYAEWITFHDKVANVAREALESTL